MQRFRGASTTRATRMPVKFFHELLPVANRYKGLAYNAPLPVRNKFLRHFFSGHRHLLGQNGLYATIDSRDYTPLANACVNRFLKKKPQNNHKNALKLAKQKVKYEIAIVRARIELERALTNKAYFSDAKKYGDVHHFFINFATTIKNHLELLENALDRL